MKNNNNELVNKNFRGFYDPFFDAFFDFTPAQTRQFHSHMKTDIVETNDAFELNVELAGYKKENVSLDYENGYLTVTATNETANDDNKKFIRRERVLETCKRSFYLGDNVNADDISANMQDGVLTVKVLKKTEELKKSSRIEIQ